MRHAPVRKENWDKISSILEVFPNSFAGVMKKFGQELIEKAKTKLTSIPAKSIPAKSIPIKNKWMYEFKDLNQLQEEGQSSNRYFKNGTLIIEDYGIQFINGSKSSDKIIIDDYDSIHALFCERNEGRCDIIFKGRKVNTVEGDAKEVQDPMEQLKLSKANRSNLVKKNMLVIAIRSVSLGDFSKVNKDNEVCVRIECGKFYTRTSYMQENAGNVNINEKLVIDLDNHPKQLISIFVDVIERNDLDQVDKDKCETETIGSADLDKSLWSNKSKSCKIALLDNGNETDISITAEAHVVYETPTRETTPCLMEGSQMLLGREILYRDSDSFKYPSSKNLFESWGCSGKFDSSLVNKNILPLCVPNKEEFEVKFDLDNNYSKFLQKNKLEEPKRDTTNKLVPHMFRFPYSKEEFIRKNYSGNYDELEKEYRPGDLVTFLTKGPILKPAKLRRIGFDGKADIEFYSFNEKDNEVKPITKTVQSNEICTNQLAGPNIFIDNQTHIPQSILNCEYDSDLRITLNSEDVEQFCEAIEIKSNTQFLRKVASFRKNPGKPAPKVQQIDGDYITGDLYVNIFSARNLLHLTQNKGDIYVKVKTYEHNFDEEQFGNFALDDSFQKGRESQAKMTQAVTVTSSLPIQDHVIFDEEKDLGTFVKGCVYDIYFSVMQEGRDNDFELGVASIRSDEYLDPYRPAKEVYLLLNNPPNFSSSIYLNVLFIPSENTLNRLRIEKPFMNEFNSAYNEWILSKNVYVDEYGFVVPLGQYHPKLVNTDILNLHIEDDSEDISRSSGASKKNRRSQTPEKRIKKAIIGIPALCRYNLDLKDKENFRPEFEEVLYKFKQTQMYLNNEAKVKANEARQEYCWNEYIQMVTDNIHDVSMDQGENNDFDNSGEIKPRSSGNMFSVANRASWNKESWQNSDLWALCRIGISHNLRSRIWYDLLGANIIEDQTRNKLRTEDFYDDSISLYETIKLITLKYNNIAFAQIDEDISIMNVSNTPARDDRGRIKNILKCFVVWEKLCKINICYSINFCYIIQRLLSIFTEDRAFWTFLAILSKMKDKLGVDESIMLDRKGMFRLLSTCMLSHTKHTMPEIFEKFTEIGLSIDFFLYDKMSSLFANSFPSNTLLRLWDLIFLEFSSPSSEGKSKGLGYIVSICLYLLNVNKEQIMLATTQDELACALNNSCCVKFETEEIILEIYDRNTKNFVAGNWFSRRLAGISKAFGDAASYLDNARISLEEDYDLIFEKTMRENKAVWSLINPNEGKELYDYIDWCDNSSSNILSRFKKQFGQKPSTQYEESKAGGRGGDLEFSTVYIYLYNCFDTQNIQKFDINLICEYNKSAKGNITVKQYDKMTVIDQCIRLRYAPMCNEANFIVKENGKELYGSFTIDLNDYKPDKVYKFWIDVICERDNNNDLEFEIGVLCERSNKDYHKSDTEFTDSLKRKLPDRVDIMNENTENDFIKKMKAELLNQINFEKSILSEYYSEKEVLSQVNYKYNFIVTKETSGMGKLDSDDLKEFNSKVLDSKLDDEMDKLYYEFTTPTKHVLDNKSNESNNIFDKAAVLLLCKTLVRRNNQLYGVENQDADYGFNLRNFIVTLVLMSKITVGQKLDLLYEIFDWDDGEGDGIDSKSIQLMLSTVMARNLQYVPSNQINNMVELLFEGEASCITSCVYTSFNPNKGHLVPFDYAVKGIKLQSNKEYYDDQDEGLIESIDLTGAFREILWKYHRFFGNKCLCFHPQYSPFRDLQQVLKLTKYDIILPHRRNCENVLCIVYISNGIKRVFTAFYDDNHQLISVGEDDRTDENNFKGVEKILNEMKYFCSIENNPKVIPKEQFMFKSLNVPYYTDFMRSETIMRCLDLTDIIEDESIPLDRPLYIHLFDSKGKVMITCEFSSAVDPKIDPGLTHKLVDNSQIGNYIGLNKGVVVIRMSSAFKGSTLNDIEERLRMGIKLIKAEYKLNHKEIESLEFDLFAWDFKSKGGNDVPLKRNIELEDVINKNGYEFVYFTVNRISVLERNPDLKKSGVTNDYDCYCLLEEIGSTNQWVQCKIHGRNKDKFIVELKTRIGFKILKNREDLLLSKIEMQKYEEKYFVE